LNTLSDLAATGKYLELKRRARDRKKWQEPLSYIFYTDWQELKRSGSHTAASGAYKQQQQQETHLTASFPRQPAKPAPEMLNHSGFS